MYCNNVYSHGGALYLLVIIRLIDRHTSMELVLLGASL